MQHTQGPEGDRVSGFGEVILDSYICENRKTFKQFSATPSLKLTTSKIRKGVPYNATMYCFSWSLLL